MQAKIGARCGFLCSYSVNAVMGVMAGRNYEFEAFVLLQKMQNLEEVARLWIPGRAQHAVKALAGLTNLLAQCLKTDGGVYIVAQHCFSNLYIPRQKAVHRLS